MNSQPRESIPPISQKKGRWGEFCLAGLIALTFSGYPAVSFLSVLFNLGVNETRLVSVPYRIVVLAMSMGLFVWAVRNNRMIWDTAVHKLFTAVFIMFSIRLAYESIVNEDNLVRSVFDYWSYWVGIGLLSIIGISQVISERVRRNAVNLIWVLSFIAVVVGLAFRRGEISTADQRLWANPMLNPITYSQCGVTLVLFSIYQALHTKRTIVIVFLAAATLPGFAIIALTASKSPVIGLFVGILILCYHGLRRGAEWRVIFGMFVGSLLMPTLMESVMSSEITLIARIFETTDNLKFGEVDRFLLWGEAYDSFWRAPFTGERLELSNGMYPHNLILESFMTMGVFGGLIFVCLFFLSIRNSLELLLVTDATWMALLGLQFFIGGMFSGGLFCFPEFWAIVLLQASTIATLTKSKIPASHQSAHLSLAALFTLRNQKMSKNRRHG